MDNWTPENVDRLLSTLDQIAFVVRVCLPVIVVRMGWELAEAFWGKREWFGARW